MTTIEAARRFLDQQARVAVWYTQYEGRDEFIRYANRLFAETFGATVEQILEKQRYRLVNPSGTPDEVIDQYKDEDIQAIEHGSFFARSSVDSEKDIVVVKLRFDQGMLGLFKFVDATPSGPRFIWQDVDVELRGIVERVRPDCLEEPPFSNRHQ